MREPEVLGKFMQLLQSEKSGPELQVQILKAVSQMLLTLKTEFLTSLQDQNLLSPLLAYLFKAKLARKVKPNQKNSVIPVTWLESRITNMRVSALENSRSIHKAIEMKCKVLK